MNLYIFFALLRLRIQHIYPQKYASLAGTKVELKSLVPKSRTTSMREVNPHIFS